MSRSDPGLGIHEDSTVNTHIIGAFLYEFLPPSLLYIVLKLYAQIAVIPCVCKSAVNFAAGVNKAS